jgi:hypothetical protein
MRDVGVEEEQKPVRRFCTVTLRHAVGEGTHTFIGTTRRRNRRHP